MVVSICISGELSVPPAWYHYSGLDLSVRWDVLKGAWVGVVYLDGRWLGCIVYLDPNGLLRKVDRYRDYAAFLFPCSRPKRASSCYLHTANLCCNIQVHVIHMPLLVSLNNRVPIDE